MIFPERCSIIGRAASCEHRNAPLRFTAMTESQSSSLSSMNELNLAMPETPALLTRMSRPPPQSRAAATNSRTRPRSGDVGGQAEAGCSLRR